MCEESDVLVRNDTWDLVASHDVWTMLLGIKWVFRIYETLIVVWTSFKTRLAAKRFHQHLSIDYYETFRPNGQSQLTFMLSSSLRQLDINHAFSTRYTHSHSSNIQHI